MENVTEYVKSSYGFDTVISADQAREMIAYYQGSGAVFAESITAADNGTVTIRRKSEGPVTLTPRAAKQLDLDHVARGTYLESPTGRRYYVSDFDDDARGTYLWILGEGTRRRRRLYQDQVPDGWTAAS